ncbi:MAG: response regulator transcription factor [Myxococcales bacterium]|nr:response regulator transcription factor [Myxococcales bacterium]
MERPRKEVVLLAEDDPDQVEILSELLSYEGYRVLSAEAPEEVLEQLSLQPDVVLLDVLGASSPAVFRAVAKMRPRPALILVSADHRLPQLAEQVRADAYVPKPYELPDLLATLRAVIEARASAEEAMSAPL